MFFEVTYQAFYSLVRMACGVRLAGAKRDPGGESPAALSSYEVATMKRILLATTVWIFAAALGFAQVPDTAGPGWKALFKPDYSDAVKPNGVWTVADGVLTASADHCLWTPTEHADFLLDLEFKNAAGTNSGVILYCTDIKDWIPKSVEIQIADDFADQWAKSPASWQCGAVFGHLAPTPGLVKKPGEWNRMTIEARGQHLKVWLNGKLTAEMDMAKWTSAKTNPDGSAIPAWLSTPFAELPTKGRIGFQGKHGDATIWFRNIRIKDLAVR